MISESYCNALIFSILKSKQTGFGRSQPRTAILEALMRIHSMPAVLAALAALAACGSGPEPTPTPEAAAAPAGDVESQVEAAVRKHLSRRSDLDMNAMDMTIQKVDVQGETAEAVVGFQVRGQPGAAMSMNYRLVRQGGEWVVQPNAGAAHAPAPQPGAGQSLPPGHPPTSGAEPSQPLPPGHPPVAQ
jgi:hypothetical protein